MNEFVKRILEYKNENKFSTEDCAYKLGITVEEMKEIENEKTSLSEKTQMEILETIEKRRRRPNRILELVFKFGATIMALVTLLLSINGTISSNTLIVLLSIGVLCLSIQNLPKIDKD